VQSTSAAELASVSIDGASGADDAEALFATIPSAQTSESGAPEDSPTEVAETARNEEALEPDVVLLEPSATGITAEGRAINDPRVDARPIEGVAVKTAIGSVFGTEAFPDAPHFASEAPRAANDPRGPIIDEPAANDELIEENEVAGA
jgi:ribonuclease E